MSRVPNAVPLQWPGAGTQVTNAPLGRPSRAALEKTFWQLPEANRTPVNFCILLLPWAFERQGLPNAAKINRRWLFGPSGELTEVSPLGAQKPIVSVSYAMFQNSPAFQALDDKVLPAAARRVQSLQNGAAAQDPEDASAAERLAEFYRLANDEAKALPAVGAKKPFTAPSAVTQSRGEVSDPNMDNVRKSIGYLGAVSQQEIELYQKDRAITDYFASIGANRIDMFSQGVIEKAPANQFTITIDALRYFFNDEYTFGFDANARGLRGLFADQPLGSWNPEVGWAPGIALGNGFPAPLVTPPLRNSSFLEFAAAFRPAFNLAFGRQVLWCQDFYIRSKVQAKSVQGNADFEVTCPLVP